MLPPDSAASAPGPDVLALERLLDASETGSENVHRNLLDIAIGALWAALPSFTADAFTDLAGRVVRHALWDGTATPDQADQVRYAVLHLRPGWDLGPTPLRDLLLAGAGRVGPAEPLSPSACALARALYRRLSQPDRVQIIAHFPDCDEVLQARLDPVLVTASNFARVTEAISERSCPICQDDLAPPVRADHPPPGNGAAGRAGPPSPTEIQRTLAALARDPICSIAPCGHYQHLRCARELARRAVFKLNLAKCPSCSQVSPALL